MLRQHGHVIFQILPDLQDGIILEQRLELGQHGIPVALFGLFIEHVRAAMTKGDVAGLVRGHGQADADQLCGHRFQAVGFGIETDHAFFARAGDPVIDIGKVGHADIGGSVDGGHGRRAGRPLRTRRRIRRLAQQRLGPMGAGHRPHPLQQRTEAVMLQKFAQRLLGNALQRKFVQPLRDGAILFQRHQHAGHAGIVHMFEQIFLHLALFHVRRGGQDAVQIAMLVQQFGRRLGADAGHAGDIVHAVAHQRQHVAQQFRADAEFLLHIVRAEPPVVHGIVEIQAGLNELHQILVRTDDGDLEALLQRQLGIGGDHIVRLHAFLLDARQRKGARGVAGHRELGFQVFRRFGAMRLVFGIKIVAEGVRAIIEDHRHMRRAVGGVQIVDQLPQHRRVAIDRANRLPMLVGERRKAMIGAEDIGRAIDEEEVRLIRHGCEIAVAASAFHREFCHAKSAWGTADLAIHRISPPIMHASPCICEIDGLNPSCPRWASE